MQKIALIIPNHLCMTPRAQKTAMAIREMNLPFQIFGFSNDEEKNERDLDICEKFKINFESINEEWKSLAGKYKEKIQQKLIGRRSFPSEDVKLMTHQLVEYDPSLVIGFAEFGLYAATEWGRRNIPYAVDIEDWYSQDLLPYQRSTLPKQLPAREAEALNKATFCFSPSHSLSNALAAEYKTQAPKVAYNSFPSYSAHSKASDFSDILNPDDQLRVYWFSQTIGPGRGLELILSSINTFPPNVTLYLQGHLPERYQKWFQDSVPLDSSTKVKIVETMMPWDLEKFMQQMDVGLALERTDIPSRNLTVTNKVFQYMQNGLAILATKTEGQLEVLKNSECVEFIDHHESASIQNSISRFLNIEQLKEAKRAAKELFNEKYSWEFQKHVLQSEINKSLSS